jgi:hypothetical protein
VKPAALATCGTLVALFIFPLLFPGETPFVNDEAMLLEHALNHNADHELADAGLVGTVGRKYGPLPVWVYQAILLVTRDPIAIMTIRITIVTSVLLLGLAWIERTLRLPRAGLIAIALSPYVWLYARQLWDNSFNIPLSVLCMAAYASFLARPRAITIMLTILLCGAMLLVHLMCAPLVLAVAVHFLSTRPRELRRFWQPIALAIVLCLFMGVRYWPQVLELTGMPNAVSREPNRFWFALLGPRVLSGAWIEYFFPPDWLAANGAWHVAFQLIRAVTLLAFPLTIIGIVAAVRRKHDIALVCTLAIAGQLVMNIVTRTYGHPHYYNGTFAAYALLMWIGLDSLINRWPRTIAIGWSQAGACTTLCVLLLVQIVRTGGTREPHFGATLGNQVAVVRELSRYSQLSSVRFEVMIWPRSLEVLEDLDAPQRTGSEAARRFVVRYAPSRNLTAGRIELAPNG